MGTENALDAPKAWRRPPVCLKSGSALASSSHSFLSSVSIKSRPKSSKQFGRAMKFSSDDTCTPPAKCHQVTQECQRFGQIAQHVWASGGSHRPKKLPHNVVHLRDHLSLQRSLPLPIGLAEFLQSRPPYDTRQGSVHSDLGAWGGGHSSGGCACVRKAGRGVATDEMVRTAGVSSDHSRTDRRSSSALSGFCTQVFVMCAARCSSGASLYCTCGPPGGHAPCMDLMQGPSRKGNARQGKARQGNARRGEARRGCKARRTGGLSIGTIEKSARNSWWT